MREMVTGLILAGGLGRRIGGEKAAAEPVARLLQWVVSVEQVVSGLVFSVAPDQALPRIPCRVPALVCEDLLPARGPLTGIFSGLKASPTNHVIVVPCDAPFVQPDVLGLLLSLRHGFDAVVPVVGGRREPLIAVYAQSCVTPMEIALNSGDWSLQTLLRELNVRYVDEDELRTVDPHLRSFVNVNTPAELEAANNALAPVRR
jgi:molybdopterin-guanine dinucleotide biosynthesis protein A